MNRNLSLVRKISFIANKDNDRHFVTIDFNLLQPALDFLKRRAFSHIIDNNDTKCVTKK